MRVARAGVSSSRVSAESSSAPASKRRVRLSKVTVTLADGKTVSFGNGLLGYALAGSTMEWLSPAPIGASGTLASAKVSATTDLGAIEARANATR